MRGGIVIHIVYQIYFYFPYLHLVLALLALTLMKGQQDKLITQVINQESLRYRANYILNFLGVFIFSF